MGKFTAEEIAALYAPVDLKDHSIREGSKSKTGKIQWFVYADRVAVQKRLDELFPGEWEFNPLREHRGQGYMSVVAEIVIRDVRRGYNGGGSLNYSGDTFDEDTEKGAMTDTFRRCASMWGIGLYLYDGPEILTAPYAKGDWNARDAAEAEAKRQFAKWYAQRYEGEVNTDTGEIVPPPPQKATPKSKQAPSVADPKVAAPAPRMTPPQWTSDKSGPVQPDEETIDGDLRVMDDAKAFVSNWRLAGLDDGDMLAALGVERLSAWDKGRAAADAAMNAYIESNTPKSAA